MSSSAIKRIRIGMKPGIPLSPKFQLCTQITCYCDVFVFRPLDEGKKLKERFDEIFDSTKYNKCMVEIRRLRKNALDGESNRHLQFLTNK